MYSLETPRLRLRPFEERDFDFLVALNADPDVARYIGHGNPRTPAETRAFFEHLLEGYEQDSRGHLLVCDRRTGAPLGRCGLTLRYCAAEVRAHLGWNGKGVHVSGTDASGHWANQPRPAAE